MSLAELVEPAAPAIDPTAIVAEAERLERAAQAARDRVMRAQVHVAQRHDLIPAVQAMESAEFYAREARQRAEIAVDMALDSACASEELRQSVAAAAVARDALDVSRAVHQRVMEQLSVAEDEQKEAEAAVGDAKRADAQAAKRGEMGTALKAARAAERELADRLEALHAALEEAAEDVAEARRVSELAQAKIGRCAAVVIASGADGLLCEVAELREKLATKQTILACLIKYCTPARSRRLEAFLGPRRGVTSEDNLPLEWREFINQVRAGDADAEVPGDSIAGVDQKQAEAEGVEADLRSLERKPGAS